MGCCSATATVPDIIPIRPVQGSRNNMTINSLKSEQILSTVNEKFSFSYTQNTTTVAAMKRDHIK
jgi:hypothetical protein